MKHIFFSLALVFGFNTAQAEIIKTPCKVKDLVAIHNALEKEEIRRGIEFKAAVLDLLEQVSICSSVRDTKLVITIPGQTIKHYELISVDKQFEVTIVNSFEEGKTYVIIEGPRNS